MGCVDEMVWFLRCCVVVLLYCSNLCVVVLVCFVFVRLYGCVVLVLCYCVFIWLLYCCVVLLSCNVIVFCIVL